MSRKRKTEATNTLMVSEPAVAYESHSVAQVFWIAFQSLSQEEQSAFLHKLLEDPDWYEEIADAVIAIEREAEPSRRYEEFEAELRREGRL